MGEIQNTAMDSFYAEGVRDERLRIIGACSEIAQSNEVGEFVYLSDLESYLEDESEQYAKHTILALLDQELTRVKFLPLRGHPSSEIMKTVTAIEAAVAAVRGIKL